MFKIDLAVVFAQASFNSMNEADFRLNDSLDSIKAIENDLGLDHNYSEQLYKHGFIQESIKDTALACMYTHYGCEGTLTLNSLKDYSNELIISGVIEFICRSYESLKNLKNSAYVEVLYLYITSLMAYDWLKNTYKTLESETPDSDVKHEDIAEIEADEASTYEHAYEMACYYDASVSNNDTINKEESMSNNVMFNYLDWEQSASKTYTYKGSNPLYPKVIGPDDFNNNALLDDCFNNLQSDSKAFYFRSAPTSDRKNGASKSFMFLKDGSAVYCVDSVSKKMRELSMSAAGGKDGIVSRPYYYISFPLAGKSRQLPLHKVLAVFAHAEELIAERNRLGLPLCGLVPNHKDNNGINNSIDNLEWVSPDENKLHSSAVELLAMADAGEFKYLINKDKHPEVWVSAKDQWVIPNRNILNFKLSIKDIYRYLENNHITIAGHSIRAIVNIHDFIAFLKSEGVISEEA